MLPVLLYKYRQIDSESCCKSEDLVNSVDSLLVSIDPVERRDGWMDGWMGADE